jgi:hypothetical protein
MPQLEPDEPLSPELVLVLSPELRAQALARLGAPAWPRPQLRLVAATPSATEPFAQSLGTALLSRGLQLALVFVAVTALTLIMSLVAHAVR